MRRGFRTPSSSLAGMTYLLLAGLLIQSVPGICAASGRESTALEAGFAVTASKAGPAMPSPTSSSEALVETSSGRDLVESLRVESPLEFPLIPAINGTLGSKWIELDQDRHALEGAIRELRLVSDPCDVGPLKRFLEEHPHSAWRGSVLANIGSRYQAAGSKSRATDFYA